MVKVMIIFLLWCLVVTLAEYSNGNVIYKYFEECKKELKYSEEDERDTKKEGCLLVCMYKKQGQMKVDGSFDFETMMSLHPIEVDRAELRKFLEKTNEKCTRKAKGDACVLAKCFSDEPYTFG